MWGSAEVPRLRERGERALARKAEVGQHHLSVGAQQYVAGLHVAVDDTGPVRVLERLRHLQRHASGRRGEAPGRPRHERGAVGGRSARPRSASMTSLSGVPSTSSIAK